MSRIPLPTSFRSENTHRLVVHLEHGPRDITERTALAAVEALAAARRALAAIYDMPPEIVRGNRRILDAVRRGLSEREIFTPRFRELACEALTEFDGWLAMHGQDDSASIPRALLAEVVEASERVADLLAAQKAARPVR
ncbi:MAG: hypothetical protein ACNS61_05920 [Candidatus Wenzhouxiangella sp. M2_3B_020]